VKEYSANEGEGGRGGDTALGALYFLEGKRGRWEGHASDKDPFLSQYGVTVDSKLKQRVREGRGAETGKIKWS